MSDKMPSKDEGNASPVASNNAHVASLYRRMLKGSISLSFVFGVLALCLYAAEYYYRQQVYNQGTEQAPAFVRLTQFGYVLGWGLWIFTGLFAYLGPYLLEKHFGACATDASNGASVLDSALLLTQRTALWGLVVGPSVGIFVYATVVEVPNARRTLYGDESDYSPTSAFDWASVLILASAVPAGTAGMVSMGIYCFGAVARHSPLWSAYLVLPSESNSQGCTNPKHSNLLMDALRLHQISGYITFWFFFLHSLWYVLIYGFEGLYESAADEDEYLSGNYTFQLDNLEESSAAAEDDAGPGFIVLFLQSAWRAIVPPPECFPLTGPGRDYTWNPFWEDHESHSHSHDHESADSFMGQEWDYDPCYGLYRNFQGLLAFFAVLVLVLTSLTVVRRWSYRFFYVMHIGTATLMVVTMCLHFQRIVFYLFPSLVCYLATTIPTVVQGWFSAYADGGVQVDEWTVLETSKPPPAKKRLLSFARQGGGDNNDGVLELTFVVDPKSGEALEATAATAVSYRPKSVRICVPSISLLWYPFTVIEQTPIETGKGQTTVRCTVLLGTVGYFTKSLWKRFHDLSIESVSQKKVEGNEDETMTGDPKQQPLVLVDGFYSGATDWIKDTMSHDSLLIAAGGTGVTPFLAFLPQILSLVLDSNQEKVPNVSFLWCCRDEALIRHVVKAYLLPLVERAREQGKSQQGAKLRLMIYNTSRKTDDETPLDLSKAPSPCKIARSSRRGAILQPSTVQYHPRHSDPTQMAQAATTFFSIAIVGVAVFVWQWYHTYYDTRLVRSFGVRLHGLYVIVAWSFVVAIGVEVYKRYNSGGIAKDSAPGGGSSTSSDKEDAEELESAEESDDSLEGATKNLRLTSLVPGKAHCYPESTEDEQATDQPVLELILCNGRPVLGSTRENMCSYWKQRNKADGVETGETEKVPTPSEVALSELANANHPGVFYCGADKLLEAIQKCVKEGQRDKRRELKNSAAPTKITDCVYYKESFEM